MWCAGIGWGTGGYECAVVDDAGEPVAQPTRFPGRGLADLIAYLRAMHDRAGGAMTVVVDSTNGLLDGWLTAVGLDVYRADPPVLPQRPPFGSADAGALARVPLTRLTRLSAGTGTLAGRYDESAAAKASCGDVEARLAADGRFAQHGPRQQPEVAVTFDDGPEPAFTGTVLDILRDHGVPATFFCVGMNAAAHPGLVARAAEEGHLLGNHTFSHPYLPDLTRDEVLRQVDEANGALARVTGLPPALVRPPYGARTPQALEWLAGAGMTTVLWDVDPGDWARPGTDLIAEVTVGRAGAGSVLLLHDGGGDRAQTVAALPAILSGLQDRGLKVVPLDRLLRSGA
jgi:peptidoglycan/xylan/chitin deacetylase (PgdA/CDA1 family)